MVWTKSSAQTESILHLVLRSKRKIHFFVMAGLDPRLSGSCGVPLEHHLSGIGEDWCLRVEQAVERPAMHQVDANQAGESEGLVTAFCPAWAIRSSRKAISATIWMRTAFSLV